MINMTWKMNESGQLTAAWTDEEVGRGRKTAVTSQNIRPKNARPRRKTA